MKPGGYIALYRSVFDNAVLDGEASRREAWIWLVSNVAWEPSIQRIGRSAVTVDRGQIAITLRSLMKQWGWPLGRVQRFIKMLRRESMVTQALVDSKADSFLYARGIVLTICNYNKFQVSDPGKQSRPNRKPIRKTQETLGLVYCLPTEESKQLESYLESQAAKKKRNRVQSGQYSKDSTKLFLAPDHPSYSELSEDYRAARGKYPTPKDGGFWFWVEGEAERPSDVRPFRTQSTAG